ncbi:MAG: arginine--tRNA ligase [Bacilli bacterium]|nr:arginine--tRNA ligase [Bacilli bacterium]
MINSFLENLRNGIKKAIEELGIDTTGLDIVLEVPKDQANGDYATNVAMRLARVARKAPVMIANDIVSKLDKKALNVSKIEVAGAGFINFTIDIEYLLSVVKKVLTTNNYGFVNLGNNQKVNLEFVSANPTGYLHIGHGRGAAYGDSLANILTKCGYLVTKEHYVNDAGNQITNMALSVYERYKELHGMPFELKDDYYHGKEIITIAQLLKDEYQDKFLNEFDLNFFKEYGTKILLNNLKVDLEKFNVNFDVWFSEKSLYSTNAVQNVIETLTDKGFVYENEGAKFLRTSDYNDEKDRVIIKSDGSYTYFLPDIAYHANKLSRGFDHLIDVLGADHHGYVDRLKAAVSMIGGNADLIDVELLQMVRVMENGEEVKMSKRSGKAITLIDLIDEVGSDALRYFYVSKALNTHMDLDLNVMKTKSNDNPVFYAQYAYARVASVFRKFKDTNNEYHPVFEFNNINKEKVKNICLTLLKYPVVLEEAGSKHLVHKVVHYIDELAYQLHSFYNEEKIICANVSETLEKLTILNALQVVLKDALNLLGINTYEQM